MVNEHSALSVFALLNISDACCHGDLPNHRSQLRKYREEEFGGGIQCCSLKYVDIKSLVELCENNNIATHEKSWFEFSFI